MTQQPEWSEQDLLKNQFLTDGPNSVANTAILIRNEGQDNASPEFIFLGDSIATLGSAYRSPCDIKLSKFQDHGMSNLALTFHYAEGKLSVVSSNWFSGFQLVQADEVKLFMKQTTTYDL